jgi:hypothetical protein
MSRRDTPEERQQRGSPEPLPGKCGAKLALTDPPRYCKRYPLKGRTRCYKCGGKSLRGPAHPAYKGGVFDGLLPSGLAEHYARARQNPDLLALTEHIAAIDGRTFELFEGLSRDNGPVWTASAARAVVVEWRATRVEFHTARLARDAAGMTAAFQREEGVVTRLSDLIARGQQTEAVWQELRRLFHDRRKLVDSEVKRRKVAGDMLTKVQAISLMAYLERLVSRHVTDPQQKQAIYDGMRLLLTSGREVLVEAEAVPA